MIKAQKKTNIFSARNGIIFSAVLIAILLGMPSMIGILTRENIKEQVERYAELSGLVVEETTVKSDWRSGLMTQRISVPYPIDAGSELVFELRTTILYGPFFDEQTGELRLLKSASDIYYQGRLLFPDSPPIIRAFKNLDGTGQVFMEIPEGEWYFNSLDKLDFKGLIAVSDLSENKDGVVFRYDMPGIEFISDHFKFAIKGLRSTLRLKESPLGLMLGSEVATINAIEATNYNNPNNGMMIIRDVDIVSESHAAKGEISGSADLDVKHINVGSQKYGPLNFQFVISGWPEREFVAMQKALIDISEKYSNVPVKRDSQLAKYMKNRGWKIITGNPRFQYKLKNLTTPSGEISGLFDVSIKDVEQTDMRKPSGFFEKLRLEFDLNLDQLMLNSLLATGFNPQGLLMMAPPEILNKIPSMPIPQIGPEEMQQSIDMAIQQNFITEKDGKYGINILVDNGKVYVNGTDMNIPLSGFAGGFSMK